ncbi:primase-helicase family protein [Vibrio sp. WJH972]
MNNKLSPNMNNFLIEISKGLTPYEQLKTFCETVEPRLLNDSKHQIIQTFNQTHSIVQHGAKTWVCERETDHKGNTGYTFSAVPQKRQLYANLNFVYMNEQNQTKTANCFDLWMKDLGRNSYHGVVFDPSDKADTRFLNMWSGFEVEPISGSDKLDRIMWHLLHVVCNGNNEHFYYLLAWMAHIIQKPEKKSGICVVLKSEARGTGKSTVSVLMEKLLGQYAMRIQDSKHLLGSFNSHLANKLFVNIEEAFWSGSNKDAGKFRTLITDSTITIEAKGKDAIEVDSYHRFLMCTNNDWAVPAHQQERRFFVLEVSECKKQDRDYFQALHRDINAPEIIGQLFNFLKQYDTSPFNLNKAPMTEALQAQIMESLPSEAEWLQKVLDDGCILDGNLNYDLESSVTTPKQSFFNSYISYCDDMKVHGYERKTPKALGKYLKQTLGIVSEGGKVKSSGQRVNCYRTRPLNEMQQCFEHYYQYQQ